MAIFDGDKPEDLTRFEEAFPEYRGLIISEPDIRDKPSVNKPEKLGIMTQKGQLKEQHKPEMEKLFNSINSVLPRIIK